MSGYIMDMRKEVGRRPLLQVGASVILEDPQGRILLQRRKDNQCWAYHGGSVELDENVEEAAKRELAEETGLIAESLELFGVYSGPRMHYVYPNGDEVSNVDVVFLCRHYRGNLKQQESEVTDLRFFPVSHMPGPVFSANIPALTDYLKKRRRPKAVVFDMDGVIFDSEQKVIECWQEVAGKYGMQEVEKVCVLCLGVNREAAKRIFLENYGPDLPYDNYKKEMSELFHRRYGEGRLPLKNGVREILSFLTEAGIPVALASSTRREVVEAELRDAGLLSYFTKVICGDMVSHSKPHPEIFLKACEELGVEPEEAIAVEDSYNGIRSAVAGGLRPVMIPDLLQPTEEIRSLTETVLPDMDAFAEYLKGQDLECEKEK